MLKKIIRCLIFPEYCSVFLCNLMSYFNEKGYKYPSYLVRRKLLVKYGIHVGLNAKVGENLQLPHPISIVIGKNTIIGDDCIVYHNVTFGRTQKTNDVGGYPTIGNNVTIYTNVLILGDVTIGSNVVIGANSVVTNSLEPNAVYAGSPARKIKDL